MNHLTPADIEHRKELARSENTPSETLANLMKDSNTEIRKLLAQNSNTPVRILQHLGEEFPEEIVTNGMFYLLLLENPDTYFIKLSLARSCSTPPETLTRLANHRYYSEEKIVRAVAKNPNTPVAVLEKLADWFPEIEENSEESDGDWVHMEVASNLNTPLNTLEKLTQHRGCMVQARIASNPNTPIALLHDLNNNRKNSIFYYHVLLALANNPKMPRSDVEAILEYLAGSSEYKAREAVLKHPFVTDTAIKIANFVRRKPGITVELLHQLATDERRHLRELVVINELATAEILDILADDKYPKIRYGVIKHKNTASDTLQRLAPWLMEDAKKWCKPFRRFNPPQRQPFLDLLRHPNRDFEFDSPFKLKRSR